MKTRRAFTLVELIIALVLSTFVLVGIIGASSQMLRYEFDSSRKGTSTNWTLMTLDQMKKEILVGNVLYCPSPPTPPARNDHTPLGGALCTQNTSTVLSGCGDWTTNPSFPGFGPPPVAPCTVNGCPLDGVAGNVTSFFYCVWDGAPTNPPWLLHYKGTTCPINPLPACGATAGYDVVAQNFYLDSGNAWYFKRADDMSGVQMQFMVGTGSATAISPNPTAQHVNVKFVMQKTYTNSLD